MCCAIPFVFVDTRIESESELCKYLNSGAPRRHLDATQLCGRSRLWHGFTVSVSYSTGQFRRIMNICGHDLSSIHVDWWKSLTSARKGQTVHVYSTVRDEHLQRLFLSHHTWPLHLQLLSSTGALNDLHQYRYWLGRLATGT